MDGLWLKAGAAWSSLATKYPELDRLQKQAASLLPALGVAQGKIYTFGDGTRYKVVQTLGEGGYSTVFLVHELCDGQLTPNEFALKQIFLGGTEEVQRAKREIEALQRVNHPNIVRLVASSLQRVDAGDGSSRACALLLFPAFKGGSAWDSVQRSAAVGRDLPLRAVLSIFIQLCSALETLHAAGLAHRDVKPQNVLLEPQRGTGIRAVLMDFGSVAAVPQQVTDRAEASRCQEESEAHSSAPYRAPELWEVEPSTTLSGAEDIWSAGCVLYFLVWGASPFERATANGQAGSLRLAVLNGSFSFPEEGRNASQSRRITDDVIKLVKSCLNADPAARPLAAEAKLQAQMALEGLADGSGHLVVKPG